MGAAALDQRLIFGHHDVCTGAACNAFSVVIARLAAASTTANDSTPSISLRRAISLDFL